MPKPLVVVESPAKAKTLSKFLGSDYDVRASVGHVADLPSKGLNIDVDNGFKPTYELTERGKTVVKDLRAALKDASELYLATDEDREGEAISWNTIRFTGTFGFRYSSRCHEIASPSRSSSVAR